MNRVGIPEIDLENEDFEVMNQLVKGFWGEEIGVEVLHYRAQFVFREFDAFEI